MGLIALACLGLMAAAVPVMAASPEAEAPSAEGGVVQASEFGTPSAASIQAGYAAYRREEEERKAELEEQPFVAQRESSRHAYADDTPAESEELLLSTFGGTLERLNAEPGRLLTDSKLDENLGHGSALITTEGRNELLEAGQPIETENAEGEIEKVNLSLERDPEGFQPENPLVEVSIGATAEEGVEVGEEGITVTEAGAENAKGRLFGGKNVFFGEVEEDSDTDLTVSPTSRGVEMFDMLRSVESPDTLRFEVDLPGGDTMKIGRAGEAQILDPEGQMVGMVPMPTAEDAQGTSVPVQMEVEGDSLVLHTNHREEELDYPILIDPEVWEEWGEWKQGKHLQGEPYWHFQTNVSWMGLYETWYLGWGGGLGMAAQAGSLTAGGYGEYYLNAPNSASYLANVMINPFTRIQWQCETVSEPYDFEGYYNPPTGQWVSGTLLYNQAASSGFTHIAEVPAPQYDWGLGVNVNFESYCPRQLVAGGISLTLGDQNYPSMVKLEPHAPSGWITNNTEFTVYAEAYDEGLGVKEIDFSSGETGTHDPHREVAGPKPAGCSGSFENPCPHTFKETFHFLGAGFNKGEGMVYVTAHDATQKASNTRSFPLKVDPEAPVLHLHGQFETAVREFDADAEAEARAGHYQSAGAVPVMSQPVYNLKVEATDGTEGATTPELIQSGVKNVEVILDKGTPEVFANPNAGCKGGSCAENITIPIKLTGLSAGVHTLTVKATDVAGNPAEFITEEFEYMPATGISEEDVLQRFVLPDGKNHEGTGYAGPELAVNVMNGNVVYHQRDVDVEGPDANLEAELQYDSELPTGWSSELGRGWTLAQVPVAHGAGTISSLGGMTTNATVPGGAGQSEFSPQVNALVTSRAGGGYTLSQEPGDPGRTSVFNSSGQLTRVEASPTASVNYQYEGEGGALSGIVDKDLAAPIPAPPPAVKRALPATPTFVNSFRTEGSTGLATPGDVAISPAGNLYVADRTQNQIVEFNPGGTFIKTIGTSGSGEGQFTAPRSVAFLKNGNFWVSDGGNNRLEEFTEAGTFVRSVSATAGQFGSVYGVAIDQHGDVLVSDYANHRIDELGETGTFIKSLAPSAAGAFYPDDVASRPRGTIWVADRLHARVLELGEGGELLSEIKSPASGEPGHFANADGIAVDSRGTVWVNTQSGGVVGFNQLGQFVAGFGAGQISATLPSGLATGTEGHLFVAAPGQEEVQVWQAPNYVPSFERNIGEGQFSHPGGVAVGVEGDIWVADVNNNRLENLEPSGAVANILTAPLQSAGKGFKTPKALAVTPDGNIWAADSGNDRLDEMNHQGVWIRSAGEAGSGNGQLNDPEGIAVAPNGNVWVADTYNYRVEEFDEEGHFIKVVNPSGLGAIEPTGIAVGAGGNVYVADWFHNRVVEFSPEGELIRQFGVAGAGKGQFSHPDGLGVAADGDVLVIDQSNSRVEEFNRYGELVTTFGSAGSGNGQFSFGYPTGLAVDEKGNLWITDTGHNRLEKWKTWAVAPTTGEEPTPAPSYPSVSLSTANHLVTSIGGAQAGVVHYTHEGELLTKDEGPEGTTTFQYTSNRLSKITLPNGTIAEVVYDPGTGRATKVTVDPAGTPPAKWTSFSYTQEIGTPESEGELKAVIPAETRKTTVEPEGEKRTFYLIDNAGDVIKSWNAQEPPRFKTAYGLIYEKAELPNEAERVLAKGDQELFVKGVSAEGIKTIQIIANGTIVKEKTCPGATREACKEEYAEWDTETEALAPGTMWVEAVLTNFLGEKASRRWTVTVPYIPLPPPGEPEPPRFERTLEFREERGLDLDLNPVANELELIKRVKETIGAWYNPEVSKEGPAALAAWERWGVPLRQVDIDELNYRLAYIAQDLPLIEEWAKAHAWSTFGGYYVDERAGGKIRVAFTENQAEHIAQMEAELGTRLAATDRITPFTTPPTSTVAQVEASAASIHSYAASHLSLQENMTTAEFVPATNDVRVEALDVPAAETEVAAAIGSLAHVEFKRAPERPQLLAGRYRSSGPVKAGDFLLDLQSPNLGCTAGFGADEQRIPGEPSVKYLLTAGHCFPVGHDPARADSPEATRNLWREVGVVAASAFPENRSPDERDVEAIRLPSEVLVPTEIYPHRIIKQPSSPAGWEADQELCFTGVTDQLQCGISDGVTPTAPEGGKRFSLNGTAFVASETYMVRLAGVTVNHGDSGSPVWNVDTGQSVGILSSGDPLGVPYGSAFITPLKPVPGTTQKGALTTLTNRLDGVGPLTVHP